MTLKTIEQVFEEVNGTTFVSIDTLTNVTLRGGKKNPLQGRVAKYTSGTSVMVFQNKKVNGYFEMVRRRLDKEGKDPTSFTLGPRVWGTRIPNTPFVEHKESLYLEVIVLKVGTVQYLVDGIPVDQSEIEGIPPVSPPEQGGLDNKVVIRVYSVGSLQKIRIQNKQYQTADGMWREI